jgi:hypothetical protein
VLLDLDHQRVATAVAVQLLGLSAAKYFVLDRVPHQGSGGLDLKAPGSSQPPPLPAFGRADRRWRDQRGKRVHP